MALGGLAAAQSACRKVTEDTFKVGLGRKKDTKGIKVEIEEFQPEHKETPFVRENNWSEDREVLHSLAFEAFKTELYEALNSLV